MRVLTPVELTSESFKDYGYVISMGFGNPMADNYEFKYWGKVLTMKMGEMISTGILTPLKREGTVSKVERHVKTPEMLIALEEDSVICVAKPSPAGTSIIEGLQAFYIKRGAAFAMHEGTWHWIPFPVNSNECKFLVLFANNTEEGDLEVKNLDKQIEIKL